MTGLSSDDIEGGTSAFGARHECLEPEGSYDGSRSRSSVSPSDFADFLNDNLAHEWIVRAAKVAIRVTAQAARALFFPDGLLVAHGGFPLGDLHAALLEKGDWNDPACLADLARPENLWAPDAAYVCEHADTPRTVRVR